MEAIDITKVTSVYSGKANRCCCGCSGKHYDVGTPAADKMARKVVKLINSAIAHAESGSNNTSLKVGERVYVAYFD